MGALVDQYYPERIAMHALYPHDRNRLPRVAVMLDFLGEIFGSAPPRRARAASRSRGANARHALRLERR
jgi:hypothetical protein